MRLANAEEFLRLLGIEPTELRLQLVEAFERRIWFERTAGFNSDLQKSVRWDHDSFSLSIQKEDTFVSHPEPTPFMERGYINRFCSNYFYGRSYVPMSEIKRRSDDYWAATNAPQLWRWQGNRPVRKLFQSRPIRTVIPGLALTRRPAGRYYSGTRKAIHRKLA